MPMSNYAKDGSIKFSIRSVDGEIKSKKRSKNLETWRDGFAFVRPEMGNLPEHCSEKQNMNYTEGSDLDE